MEEKKTIKVSLATVICIVIIFILLFVIGGMWYYYNFIQKSNNNQNQQNIISTNNIEKNVNNNEIENTDTINKRPSETIKILFNDYMEAEEYICSLWNDNNSAQGIQFYENEVFVGDAIVSGLQSEYSASSTYKENGMDYKVDNLGEFYIDKCWCEGVTGSGIGEVIEINTFASSEKVEWNLEQKRSMKSIDDTIEYLLNDYNNEGGRDGTKITKDNISNYYSEVNQVAIINGYAKNDKLWKNNNRVKTLKLTIDDTKQYILELEDTKDLQLFDINYKNDNITKKINMKFEILEVYPGEKYDDTCITSIYLEGGSNIRWGGR